MERIAKSHAEAMLSRQARSTVVAFVAIGLVACAGAPVPSVRRNTASAAITEAGTAAAETVIGQPQEEGAIDERGPRPQIRRGTGEVINLQAAAVAPPAFPSTGKGATFNFEGESLHAVVKAILGDMLEQNYVIAPGVQGTVTLGTPKPVSSAEALNLLEMVLGWNNARLVYSGGRYNILPADQALASGAVAPRTGAPSLARGYEVRTVPLRYISASEMEKVLKPYARADAVINADNARNVISIAGTRAELENYLRTIEIFDVDWLAGMSVGVFPLASGRANKVVADLENVFGEQGRSPVAGMFRFMPLDGANAILVITQQASYLDDIQEWLDRIESAGADTQLFSYELKYIKARDLAARLAEVFSGDRAGDGGGSGTVSVMTGLEPTELRNTGGAGPAMAAEQGSDSSTGSVAALNAPEGGNATAMLQVNGGSVGVSAVEETNSLLVRSTPGEWKAIKSVIAQLDVMPLQVQIEAQVAQVQLSGDLAYGVNWYFEKAVTDAGLPSAAGRTGWSTLAGSILPAGASPSGLSWTLLGRNAAAVISALDSVTNVRLLQTPSVVVRNNSEATFNVGSRIPISSVTLNPTDTTRTVSQVQYLDTGTILKVRPRISKDGMVFLNVVQEISAPVGQPDANGNVRIDTRKLKTEAAIQSGDTVMLAGLIDDGVSHGASGFPGLSRIPVLGGLFGRRTSSKARSETIVLITPTVVRNPQEARALTDEYGQRFRALHPLKTSR